MKLFSTHAQRCFRSAFSPLTGAYQVVSRLQGRRKLLSSAKEGQQSDDVNGSGLRGDAPRSGAAESHRSTAPPRPASSRRTMVLLRPEDFDSAISTATRKSDAGGAWTNGTSVPGTLHPVKVSSIGPSLRDPSESARGELAALLARLYAEGHEWWYRGHAGGSGYDGRG